MNTPNLRPPSHPWAWAALTLAAGWALTSLRQAPAPADGPRATGGAVVAEHPARPTSATVPGWLTRELFESLEPGMKQDQVLDYLGRAYCKLDARGVYGETYVCPDGPRGLVLRFDRRRLLEWATQSGLE